MDLKHFATALTAVSLLSFAAAACSERQEPDAVQADGTATPAPPIEASELPDDTLPPTPAAESPSPTY